MSFLHPVAASIGGPAVRNMGTVGGNLFAPAPFGDFTVALLALDATVALQGSYGAREIAIEEFLAGRDRMQGGLVLSRLVPAPGEPGGVPLSQDCPHQAEGRRRDDVRSASCRRAAVASSAPASRSAPWRATAVRAKAAERALEGRPLDAATIAAAAAAVTEGTSPIDDSLASAWYRREVAGVHLRRLLAGEA